MTDGMGTLPFEDVKGVHTCGLAMDGNGGVRVSCYALRSADEEHGTAPGTRFALTTRDTGESWALASWPSGDTKAE